ncbi:MAG: adenylate/guanylate cyclase domain-containing protein [Alphaproteobacteria bacterium]|nr:adenylate/guanylate cyclase domain-containing protein [Alphaproteobacteria bacterium]
MASQAERRRRLGALGLLLFFMLIGAAGGALYRLIFDPASEREAAQFARSMAQGMLLATALFLADNAFTALEARYRRRPPLLASFLIRAIALSGVIVVTIAASEALLTGHPPSLAWLRQILPRVLGPALLIGFLIQAAVSVASLVGLSELLSFVLGRYRRPIIEERIVMFADLVGSTRIAERLGEAGAQELLATLFREIDPVFRGHGARVMSYVGDAVIVTWPCEAGNADRALACGLELERRLRDLGPGFEARFGVRPELRVSAHAGPVAIGEIGESRKQIALLGDVVNVAARMEEEAKARGERFLASEALLERAAPAWRGRARSLGPRPLRGRAEPVELFAI